MTQDCRIFFVTGYSRSGTSLLHSLLCTSPLANPYVKECSWLTRLIDAYRTGRLTFSVHTSSFFDSPEAFREYNRALLGTVLADTWRRLGGQPCLVLKDPELLFVVSDALEVIPGATMVLIVRDVRDVVASQLMRMRRQHQDPDWYDTAFLDSQVAAYVSAHTRLVEQASTLGQQVVCVRYETLARRPEAVLPELERQLALPGLDAAKAWKRANFDITSFKDNEAYSALYGQRISSANIGRYAGVLTPEDAERLMEHHALVDRLFAAYPRRID